MHNLQWLYMLTEHCPSLLHVCVCVCVCVCIRCVFCSLVITVFVFLQVIIGHAVSSVINQLTNDYYKCFCVAGEGGNSEVY